MKRFVTLLALEIAGTALTGFCFTAGAMAMRKLSERTGVLKTEDAKEKGK